MEEADLVPKDGGTLATFRYLSGVPEQGFERHVSVVPARTLRNGIISTERTIEYLSLYGRKKSA